MWFKNLRLFEFQDTISYDPTKLAQMLESLSFRPCPKSLPISYGWVPPIGEEEDNLLVYGQNNFMLLRLRVEERVLPASVVRDKLNQEVADIEKKTGRRVYKDEKERLRDDIYQTLLAQSFTKSSYINAYIDCEKNWLVVDCASSKKLANFISLLNKCLDNPVTAPELEPATRIMTDWLLNNSQPASLSFANACVLKEPEEDGCTARIKNENLLSNKVQNFLKEGSNVIQLALQWSEQIRFTLKEDFSFGSVNFLESVKDLARDGTSETKEERLAADFLIMTQTLQQFYSDLLPCFSLQEEAVAV